MGEATVIERIAAWEAAGLIDASVAARLREAEMAGPDGARPQGPRASAASFFGPTVSIAEMFGYLGTGFVLAAWYVLVGRIAGFEGDHDPVWALGHGLAATAFTLLGAVLLRGPDRARRAAGAAFIVAAGATVGALNSAGLAFTNLEPSLLTVVAAAGGLVAMAAFRRIHPGLLTHLGLIAGITQLAYAIQGWAERVLFPTDDFGAATGGGPDPIVKVVLTAGLWLLVALIVGLIGRREAAAGTIAADRRAALSRVWAGLVAVLGVAAAVITTSQYDPVTFESRRVLEPAIGDLAILLIAVILLERAFRREASAFVYPAGLGVIIALTDLNASYLAKATSTEIGLLVEGVILLVVGFAIERLRRRVVGGPGAPDVPPVPVGPEAEPAA